ncbi:MAG: hypothetical protein ACOY33_03540 [Pseudomonadota bacterium]
MSLSFATGNQSEVVLFFGEGGVCKGLLYSDFEAVLDGVVGMQEFAGHEMKAAYVTVNGRMLVTGVVLFLISFDERGVADRSWNIPLRHMVEKADRGPDLGAGPVRLACRSQCPISWQQSQLWDPNMKQGANDFVFIRDAIRERGRYLGLTIVEEPEPQPAPPPNWGMPPQAAGWSEPAAAPAAAPVAPPVLVPPAPPVLTPPPVVSQVAPPVVTRTAEPGDTGDVLDQIREERVKLARTIKDLRLQVTTMETQHTEEVARANYAFQQKEEILNSQLEKLLSQFKSLKAQNAALREQATAQRAQIDSLHDAIERQADAATDGQSQAEEVRRQVEREMHQRLEEETAKLREELHVREMDLINRDEKIEQYKEQIVDLQRSQSASQASGADKFLEKLEKLGVSFIAFHPGAGHVSIPFKHIQRYVENPLAYAAEKCLVTEDRYRAWIAHYENPACIRVKADGKVCGTRLIRVDVPSKFKPGDSDTCAKCQGDQNIANVLAFR